MLMHEILRNKMQKLLITELVGINTKECTLSPGRHCGGEGQRNTCGKDLQMYPWLPAAASFSNHWNTQGNKNQCPPFLSQNGDCFASSPSRPVTSVWFSVCVVMTQLGCQPDIPGQWTLRCRTAFFRLACRHVCKRLCWLMSEGSAHWVWAVPPLARWSWTV